DAESFLRKFCKENRVEFTIVRPYITYSSKRIPFGLWEGAVVPYAIKNNSKIAVTSSHVNALTNVTSSKYLARCIATVTNNPIAYGEDYNITNAHTVSWKEYLELTAKAMKGN